MGVGTSLFLIAVGAILDFGVHPTGNTHGIDVNTIGLILMVIGVIGLLLSLLFWTSWGGAGIRRRTTYVDAPVARRTTTYVDPTYVQPQAPVARRTTTYVDDGPL